MSDILLNVCNKESTPDNNFRTPFFYLLDESTMSGSSEISNIMDEKYVEINSTRYKLLGYWDTGTFSLCVWQNELMCRDCVGCPDCITCSKVDPAYHFPKEYVT